MGEVKKDCILYDKGRKTCRGLNKLWCEREEQPCSFYRPGDKYYPDGTPKSFLLRREEEKTE